MNNWDTTKRIFIGAFSALTIAGLFFSSPIKAQEEVAAPVENTPVPGNIGGVVGTLVLKDSFYQPTPLYMNKRVADWNTVPHSHLDTNRIPCETGAANALGEDIHCNDYLDAHAQGTSLSGVSNPSPHETLLDPLLYSPLCAIDISYDFNNKLIGYGWDFDSNPAYGGCYGFMDPVTVPGIDPEDNNPNHVLLSNSASDWNVDKHDNVTPFFPLGDSDPVNLAFEQDLLALRGNGALPISVATGNFVKSKEGVDEKGAAKNYDVAILRRGNNEQDGGYVSVLPAHGGTEYDDGQVYDDVAAEDTGNPVFILSIPMTHSVDVRTPGTPGNTIGNNAFDGTNEADNLSDNQNYEKSSNKRSVALTTKSNREELGTSKEESDAFGDLIAGLPFRSAFNIEMSHVPDVGLALAQTFADSYIEADIKLYKTGYAASNEYAAEPAAGPVGNDGEDFHPDIAIVNRNGVDCFGRDGTTRFINSRNPAVDAVTGNIQAGDANKFKMSYYKSSEAAAVNLNAAANAEGSGTVGRCGYLTVYDIVDEGNAVSLNPLKDPESGKIIKIPLGFNPTMCEFTHDMVGNGYPDIICTNTGAPEEGIYGSFTIVSATTDDDELKFNIFDINVTKDDAAFPHKHPWWLTAGVFSGKKVRGLSGTDFQKVAAEALQKKTVHPADFIATYLDAHERVANKSAFTVHINDVDQTVADKPAGFKFENEPKFKTTAFDTEPLAAKVGPKNVPTVEPLALNKGLYPLGITSGYFSKNLYQNFFGYTEILGDILSHEYFFGGYIGEWDLTDSVRTRSYCRDIVIGFNNGRDACVFKNTTENVTLPDGSTVARCTGEFKMPNNSTCSDTSSPVYNMAHNNDMGNWGNKYLAPTQYMIGWLELKDTDADGNKTGGWTLPLRFPLSVNLATERSYRFKAPNDFGPDIFYKDGNAFVFDFQFDTTPDLAALMGPVDYLPEQQIETGSATTVDSSHPHLSCDDSLYYESTTVISNTFNVPDDNTDPDGNIFYPGDDPSVPHRCYQRHMMADAPAGSPYGKAAAACCIMLETPPSDDYVGYDVVEQFKGDNCPGKDPMECCVAQVLSQETVQPVQIDWKAAPAPTTNVSYNADNADEICDCLDVVADYHAVIMQSILCQIDPVMYTCPTADELTAAQAALCECNPDHPSCDPDDDDQDCADFGIPAECCNETGAGPMYDPTMPDCNPQDCADFGIPAECCDESGAGPMYNPALPDCNPPDDGQDCADFGIPPECCDESGAGPMYDPTMPDCNPPDDQDCADFGIPAECCDESGAGPMYNPALPDCNPPDDDDCDCDDVVDPQDKLCCEAALAEVGGDCNNIAGFVAALADQYEEGGLCYDPGETTGEGDGEGDGPGGGTTGGGDGGDGGDCNAIFGDNICGVQCCVNIVNNGQDMNWDNVNICSNNNINCGGDIPDPCDWFPEHPNCQGDGDTPPAESAGICDELVNSGMLSWQIDKREDAYKGVKDVIFRAGDANLVLNMSAGGGKLFQALNVAIPDGDLQAMNAISPNVEIRQMQGTQPEIQFSNGNNVTVSSVKDEPLNGPALLASGKLLSSEQQNVNMAWSLQCKGKERCDHDESNIFRVTITHNSEVVECDAPPLLRRGGIFGGSCTLNPGSSVSAEHKGWLFGLLFAAIGTLWILRRQGNQID